MINVLLIGSGGREHALALGISASPFLKKLYACPGNPGISALAEIVAIDIKNHDAIISFCKEKQIDFVVVGPEVPLVAGLVDDLNKVNIKAFGPTKAASQLEGSKGFTKDLCKEAGIPTAAYERFTNVDEAKNYVKKCGAPIVIKADGLAAGKGVTVAATLDEALHAIEDCFSGSFGQAGAEVVVEEFLEGEEVSYFVLTDGTNILPLTSAQDHKRVGENDTGANTGGMGAYSPAPIFTKDIEEEVLNRIIRPTIATMQKRGTPFKGVLYAGLMLTKKGPQLIEYNCRFGDPETQVLIPRLKSDLLTLLLATAEGNLKNQKVEWRNDVAITVVMAAKGYPQKAEQGSIIKNTEALNALDGITLFHAGTALRGGALIAAGGRVLNVTALGTTIEDARARAYQAAKKIDWKEGFYRNDIGAKALKKSA